MNREQIIQHPVIRNSPTLIPHMTGCQDSNAHYRLINLSNIKH